MDPIEQFLDGYPPEIQAITNKLRGVVMRSTPGAKEVLYAKDCHFGYSFSGRYIERLMYLAPMKDYVRLGFFWGGYLPDPARLLAGEGKRLRHVKVYGLKEAANPKVKALVQAAWADAQANRKQSQAS